MRITELPAFPFGEGARGLADALLAGTGDGVGVFDATGNLIDWNEPFGVFWRFPSRDAHLNTGVAWTAHVEIHGPGGGVVSADQWAVAQALRGIVEVDAPYILRQRGTPGEWGGRISTAPIRGTGGEIVGGIIITRDTSGEVGLHEELRESRAMLRDLISGQERVRDEERKRISRELHDGLQQVLTALNMKLGMAVDAVPRDPDAAVRWLDDAQDSVIDTSQAIRDMITALRPQGIADRGLRDALDGLARTQASVGRMTCEFSSTGLGRAEPPPEVSDCLFRVAQEAFANVIKHAGATRVQITLAGQSDGALRLRITDNGRGIDDAPAARGSLGLIGMRERVRAVGGTLLISGEAGAGTTIEVTVPAPTTPRKGIPHP